MDRILIALGPPFGEKLPRAPTNDTLATVPTEIQINAEPCPDKYKRCSSQTYYPSCEVPHRTDADIWPQRFNMYFNLSREITSRVDVMNATLRLYKNTSLLLETPTTLLIEVFRYIKRLTRRRSMHRIVVSAQVSSDFIGWVTLPVEPMLRRWRRRRNNHGLLVTVKDEDNRPWDAIRIFVPMDCDTGNNSFLPLPFEVQTKEEGERYPALNIRLGSPEDEPATIVSTSPAPEESTLENSTQMQSDDPTIYEYDYTASSTIHHTSETPERFGDGLERVHGDGHLTYHHSRHSNDEADPVLDDNSDEDSVVTLIAHHPGRHHRHNVEREPAARPSRHHPDLIPQAPTYPTLYHNRADLDDYDEPQPEPTPQALVSPPPSHNWFMPDEQMTDQEIIRAAEQQWASGRSLTAERAATEEERIAAEEERILEAEAERERTSNRRLSLERDGRKNRRDRQRGNNGRRNRRKNRRQNRRE